MIVFILAMASYPCPCLEIDVLMTDHDGDTVDIMARAPFNLTASFKENGSPIKIAEDGSLAIDFIRLLSLVQKAAAAVLAKKAGPNRPTQRQTSDRCRVLYDPAKGYYLVCAESN